jgi:hypothetical protein
MVATPGSPILSGRPSRIAALHLSANMSLFVSGIGRFWLRISFKYLVMESRECLNPDLSVEMEDNSIGKESQHSWPDYNHPEMLHLSNRYTNSHGWRDPVEHDDLATRAPILQAIEELARTSRASTELWHECEVLLAKTQWGWGSVKQETGSLANNTSPAEVGKAKSNQQNQSVPNDSG